MVINNIHSLLHGGDTHHLKHRAKNFSGVTVHVDRNVIDKGAADKETIFIAFNLRIATIHDHIGTLLLGTINKAHHLLLMLPGNHRAKVIAGIGAGTHFQVLHSSLHFADQSIGSGITHGNGN